MKKLLAIGILIVSANCFAALSPYYDSVEKIETILQSYPLSNVTAGPITSIRQIDFLNYEVAAGSCSAQVTLQAHPPDMPGKTTYSVQTVSKPDCHPTKQ